MDHSSNIQYCDLSSKNRIYIRPFYQSPLILTELFQHNLINVSNLTACYLYQVMMTLHFLNDVAKDAETTPKIKNYVMIASLKNVQQWVNW